MFSAGVQETVQEEGFVVYMKRVFITALLFMQSFTIAMAADTLSCRILQENNWAFYGTDNPVVKVSLANSRKIAGKYDIKCEVRDFLGNSLYDISQTGSVAPQDSSLLSFSFKALQPGFYNVVLYDGGRYLNRINVAKEPEKSSDALSVHLAGKGATGDFVYLANTVALERRDIRPQYSIFRNKELSGREKNVYNFSMVSRGDEKVAGYMAFPKGKKDLPLIITLVPMEERAANPLADFTASAGYAELVIYLKQRGEGTENVKNLLTDMLLGIDYAFVRQEIDPRAVYVQGRGYGAACAMVASALEGRVAGSFMESPDVELLAGAYSIESIADHIKAPLLLGTGLQRDVYELQEIFSIYNKVCSQKEYFVIPDSSQLPRQRWKYIRDTFILRMQK